MAHWRDHLDSTLLGAYSLFDDATEGFKTVDGYVLKCTDEIHILGASGKKKCFVAYTTLDAKKPMKINVSIGNEIALGAGSKNPEKWFNVPVTFYVDERVNSKDGVVAAIRVKHRIEQKKDFTKNIELLRACKTLPELVEAWKQYGHQEIANIKDEMKEKLTPKENVQTN